MAQMGIWWTKETSVKTADQLLDDIWKQRYQAIKLHYRPKLLIWINEIDIETIMLDKSNLFSFADFGDRSMYPTKLFGEKLAIASDTKPGEPFVEVVD